MESLWQELTLAMFQSVSHQRRGMETANFGGKKSFNSQKKRANPYTVQLHRRSNVGLPSTDLWRYLDNVSIRHVSDGNNGNPRV